MTDMLSRYPSPEDLFKKRGSDQFRVLEAMISREGVDKYLTDRELEAILELKFVGMVVPESVENMIKKINQKLSATNYKIERMRNPAGYILRYKTKYLEG